MMRQNSRRGGPHSKAIGFVQNLLGFLKCRIPVFLKIRYLQLDELIRDDADTFQSLSCGRDISVFAYCQFAFTLDAPIP